VAFRQEVCDDLQVRLRQQQAKADRRVLRERTRVEVASRLEGLLPRHILMKALA